MGLEIKDYCEEKIGDFFAGYFFGDFCLKEGKGKMRFCKKHVEWRKKGDMVKKQVFFLNEFLTLLRRCVFFLSWFKGSLRHFM